MSTDKPRFTITVDPALMQEIEDYRYNHRIKNQTQAVISLMQRGLQEIMETEFSQPQQPVEQYSADEQQLIDDYRSLNEQGQEYIRQTMYMAKQTHKKMPDLSDLEKQA
ncbi:hypothetical protein [Agathobaculum sp.]|jgi:hypothetical protein|uniref:hypothetical protein n=1 Tax=Agathobaculum sp. TaxID=2048138 RepID=UPI003A89DFF3